MVPLPHPARRGGARRFDHVIVSPCPPGRLAASAFDLGDVMTRRILVMTLGRATVNEPSGQEPNQA
jgi:hypothetical protein